MGGQYVYLWEYFVPDDCEQNFTQTYGPAGEWVLLFRRGEGYLRTELYRDRSQPGHFVTIDYWQSKEAWEAFRTHFAEEYEALDARCGKWTASETEIGRFEPVD